MLTHDETAKLRQSLQPKNNTREQAFRNFVRPLITQNFEFIPAYQIRPDSNLHTDLGLDSIDRMELVMLVEQAFHIQLTDREAAVVRTPDDLCRIVCANINAPIPAAPTPSSPKILFNFRKIFSDLLAMREKTY
ncbi:acyl carrier protein [bacterium]|nr:acyl carrier protein [bacterium]